MFLFNHIINFFHLVYEASITEVWGYSIVFLTLSIPMAIMFQCVKNRNNFRDKFKYFVIFIIIVFNLKISPELTMNSRY